MENIEIITVVENNRIFWRAIDHSTGIKETGLTPSKAISNLRIKINKFLRELDKGERNV